MGKKFDKGIRIIFNGRQIVGGKKNRSFSCRTYFQFSDKKATTDWVKKSSLFEMSEKKTEMSVFFPIGDNPSSSEDSSTKEYSTNHPRMLEGLA